MHDVLFIPRAGGTGTGTERDKKLQKGELNK